MGGGDELLRVRARLVTEAGREGIRGALKNAAGRGKRAGTILEAT
jgi:hypothetical protein